jgi:hypothetical protein
VGAISGLSFVLVESIDAVVFVFDLNMLEQILFEVPDVAEREDSDMTRKWQTCTVICITGSNYSDYSHI